MTSGAERQRQYRERTQRARRAWSALPWGRIEKSVSWIARMHNLWEEEVPDVRSDITLGTYQRMLEGLPLDAALARAVSSARNNIVRNRVCGITGRWSGLFSVKVVGDASSHIDLFTRRVLARIYAP